MPKALIEYLNTHSLDELYSEVEFKDYEPSISTEFEDLTNIIFENLNIKVLTLSRVNSKLITSQFYDKIKNCHSLRKVNFEIYDDAHAYLDIIEANSHVKAWDVHFGDKARFKH